jgi:hypothetical protein
LESLKQTLSGAHADRFDLMLQRLPEVYADGPDRTGRHVGLPHQPGGRRVFLKFPALA